MTDFAAWLGAIGLGRHAEAQRANDVDFDVLRTLSAADLKELGLLLGDRRRLLQAIAALDAAPAAMATSSMGGAATTRAGEAERAVRSGLAIVAAVAKLSGGGEKLAARIGIATGLVVVGDLAGEGAAQEQAMVGDTPNLAARLQGLAEPGTVVIAEATRRLLGDLFELRALGAQSLKGLAEPVPAFAVLGERAALAGLPEAALAEAMRKLVEAELVFRRGTPPDAAYLFKHALVRDAAEPDLRRALEIAHDQRSPTLQLRAARDLARLLGERGERRQAADLLEPIYARFTEGFATADMIEARALLEQLR